ncbi:type II secretion system protein [Leptothrix ochracea]|uniref:type II secretion system protein n=1 Tax=Leptothrix ochracea TaxID=735331 RepID=UPI0034E26CC7
MSRRCRQAPARLRSPSRGVLLLGVLVFLAVASYTTVLISQRWADERQRMAEEDLLYVGLQYRLAIESYYQRPPNGLRQLPLRLEDLVSDPRYPMPVRHIRKLYRDPLAPNQDWGLILLGGRIAGVYSQASGQPFRTANFDPRLPNFGTAKTYADWRFTFSAAVAASGAASGGTTTVMPPRVLTPMMR